MRGRLNDITGQRFGNLVIITRSENTSSSPKWVCLCDCGDTVVRSGAYLNRKIDHVRDCGKHSMPSKGHPKHGMSQTRIHQIWLDIFQRCYNPKSCRYSRYGGRGITVCDEWRQFENFYNDMKEGYSDDLTIDRRDVNGNYEKSNCKWSTQKEQGRNRCNTLKAEINGVIKPISEWAEIYGVSRKAIYYRMNAWGVNIEDAINNKQYKKAI